MTAGHQTQIHSPGVDWIRADIVSFVITYISSDDQIYC